jgi:hypothetical protein
VPLKFSRAVEVCRASLLATGRIPLPEREALVLALYANTDSIAARRLGQIRHVALDTLAVRKVLPLWHEVFPDDDGPEELLRLSRAYLAGDGEAASLRRKRDDNWVDWVENRAYEDGQWAAMFVAAASAAVVTTALIDDLPDPADTRDDMEYDADSLTAAAQASYAAAGGMPHQKNLKPGEPAAFWEWWLTEALPRVAVLDESWCRG